MAARGSTHTGVVRGAGAADAFRARHAALFEALAAPGFGVGVLAVEDGEQSMEQALFARQRDARVGRRRPRRHAHAGLRLRRASAAAACSTSPPRASD
ncbi:MAG: hypothetical protein U0802_22385 [Candidatus Binatia bacterium]